MPRSTAKRRARRRTQDTQSFVFEIRRWTPQYLWSVNNLKFIEGPFWESVGIDVEASCVLPKKVAGRTAIFDFRGARDIPDPDAYRRNPDWKPKGVAALDLPPSNGRCSCSVPIDHLAFLLTGFARGCFKFIVLNGPPLRRGKSVCRSIYLEQSLDLEE